MKKYILTLILALASLGLYAQTNRNKTIINAALHGWEYEIKAGVNLGGTAPLPFPEEIRGIDGYNPTYLSLSRKHDQVAGYEKNGESSLDCVWRIKACAPKQR